MTSIDEADLILIGAAALHADPDELVDRADVAALARVVAHVEAASTPIDAAAVLVAILRELPFPYGNAAAAWLAAVQVLGANRFWLRISEGEARALVVRAHHGQGGVGPVVASLATHLERRPGRVRRVVRCLFAPRREEPRTWPCPVCGRPLEVAAWDAAWMRWPRSPAALSELSTRCCRYHRVHAPDGRPLPSPAPVEPETGRWCPMVQGPQGSGADLFLAIVAAVGVLFRRQPADGGGASYEAILVRHLHPGDLVGDWHRLVNEGESLGYVPTASIRFDRARRSLDWYHLTRSSPGALNLPPERTTPSQTALALR